MFIKVGSNIIIRNPNIHLFKVIQKELTIANPHYALLQNMNKWVGNTPEYFRLYKRIGNDIVIPFGAVSNPKIKKHLIGVDFVDETALEKPIYLKEKIELRDYQEIALNEMVKRNRGILVGQTGSGKTNIGLMMIKKLGFRALWITHTIDLLKQSRDRAKAIFENVDVGYITDGQVDIGNDITFATVQTLNKVVHQVKDEFNIIIVDEAHRCIGSPTLVTMFYNTLDNLNAKYKYGLTATPDRIDGYIEMTFAILGEVSYEIPKEATEGYIVPFKFSAIDNNKDYNIADYTSSSGMLDPQKLQPLLYLDDDRNDLVVDSAIQILKNSTGVLVLTKRVAQGEYIHKKLLDVGVKSGLLVGKINAKTREDILENDKYEVIVATSSIAKEGLDIPRLSDLILAYPVTNKNEFTQVAGRVRRKYKDKKFGYVYEIRDNSIERNRKRVNLHYKWTKDLNK